LKNNIFAKFARATANIYRGQRGMTGLETAIILIAFVTVAAVFGYAVLSAGLFSAERGKETIYAGLQQAKANMEVSGSVIAVKDNDTDTVGEIRFTVRNAVAGTPIDMTPNGDNTSDDPHTDWTGENRCVLSMTTGHAYYNNILWDIEAIGADDNDNLLESGEQMEITITLEPIADLGTITTGTWQAIGPNDWFNIQVKPILGSTMTIQRTLPAGLDDLMDLH
jgi:archaeal flagellin FlaB